MPNKPESDKVKQKTAEEYFKEYDNAQKWSNEYDIEWVNQIIRETTIATLEKAIEKCKGNMMLFDDTYHREAHNMDIVSLQTLLTEAKKD